MTSSSPHSSRTQQNDSRSSRPAASTRSTPRAHNTGRAASSGSGARGGPASGPSSNAARRAARRRQAFGRRVQRFEAILPALRLDGARLPLSGAAWTATPRELAPTRFAWSKIISSALLLAVVACLGWLQYDTRWYVYADRVDVSGQSLVPAGALVKAAAVDGWNLFWLRNDDVQERVEAHPWVSAADVNFTLPAGIRIAVQEEPPIALWVTDAGMFWISPTGAALPVQEEPPASMPRLIDPALDAAVPGSQAGSAVDTRIVASALALIAQVPGVTEVRYSPEIGLNFGMPGSTLYIYWGDGENVEQKLENIALARQLVAGGELPGNILDVRFPARPTVR